MKKKSHIGLISSLAIVTLALLVHPISFIFSYILLATSITSAIVFYVFIVIYGNKKYILNWTIIPSLTLILIMVSGVQIGRAGYFLLYKINEKELTELKNELLKLDGSFYLHNSSQLDHKQNISHRKLVQINKMMEKAGIYFVSKSNQNINLGTFGFLSNRHGLIYTETPTEYRKQFHLVENWYYY